MDGLNQWFATLQQEQEAREMRRIKVQTIAEASGYHPLILEFLAGREYRPLLKDPYRDACRDQWRALFMDLRSRAPSDDLLVECFETRWHESHHYIRELVEDDPLLLETLWVWLPRYLGGELQLYRGENIDRWEHKSIGWAWTTRLNVAERFASGLNAVGGGGVILRAVAPVHAIIAGPSAHSRWLGEDEHTVDTRRLNGLIVEMQRFRPCT